MPHPFLDTTLLQQIIDVELGIELDRLESEHGISIPQERVTECKAKLLETATNVLVEHIEHHNLESVKLRHFLHDHIAAFLSSDASTTPRSTDIAESQPFHLFTRMLAFCRLPKPTNDPPKRFVG